MIFVSEHEYVQTRLFQIRFKKKAKKFISLCVSLLPLLARRLDSL